MPQYSQAGIQPVQGPTGVIGAMLRANKEVQAHREAENAKRVALDPNSTPIQQAIAIAQLGHEKLGSDVLKKNC